MSGPTSTHRSWGEDAAVVAVGEAAKRARLPERGLLYRVLQARGKQTPGMPLRCRTVDVTAKGGQPPVALRSRTRQTAFDVRQVRGV